LAADSSSLAASLFGRFVLRGHPLASRAGLITE